MTQTVKTWTLTKQSDGVRGMRGGEKQYLVCVVEHTHWTTDNFRYKVETFWGKEELSKDELQMKESKNFMTLSGARMEAKRIVEQKLNSGYNLNSISSFDTQYTY